MKVDRESFLAASLALSAALSTGCDLPAEIANRLSPQKQAQGEPALTPEANRPRAADEATVVDRGGDGFERGPANGPGRQLASPTNEAGGSNFVAPTQEAGGKQFTAPTNEGAKTLPAPTKEAGLPAPTKETGYKPPPAPAKER